MAAQYSQGVVPITEEENNTNVMQNVPSSEYSDQVYNNGDNQAESNDMDSGQMIVNEDTYIGEFQTEYINQEIYNLFENEGMITRNDLYLCAKAMGGWTQDEGKLLLC